MTATAIKMAGSQGSRRLAGSQKKPNRSTYLGRVAARLRELREQAGYTSAAKFAEAITNAGYEVHGQTVYGWEIGTSSPHVGAMPAITKALQIPIAEILPPR